jgi:amino acid permease
MDLILGVNPVNERSDSLSPSGSPLLQDDRNWWGRTFGQLQKGALRGAIFSLVSTAIGAGCLTLPLVFMRQGIVLGAFLITLAVGLCYFSLISIALAGEKYQTFSYIALTEVALGKVWGFIVQSSIILYVIGTIIGYQIMVGFFMPSILGSFNIDATGNTTYYIIMVASNVLLMTPLSMFRELSSLRFVSLLSAFSLVYISVLVIAEFPFFAYENSWSALKWFGLDVGIISSFNLCVFSSCCHTNISQIQGELINSNQRRITKVSRRAMLAIYFSYLALGLFGYLSTLHNTPSLIIMRHRPSDIKNDFLMVIGRVLMTVTLIIAVPVNIPPCRTAIIKSWLLYKDEPPLYV